jgi:cation:H+ antiporter
VPESWQLAERVGVSVAYLALGLVIFAQDRRYVLPLLRDGFLTPYRHLNGPARVGSVPIEGE